MSVLGQGWLITQRDLRHWVRQPAGLLITAAFDVMILAMFVFLFGGAMTVPGGETGARAYVQFLLPGMLALAMLFGLETTMTATSTDARLGITDRFRTLPISAAAVVLGRAGADLAASAVQLVVLLAAGLAFGWRPTASPLGAVVAIALLLWLRFALLWIGIFAGLIFRGPGAVSAVQILVWPLGFFSNVFVDPSTMPAVLRVVAEVNPVSATAAVVRQAFTDPAGVRPDLDLLWALGWPLVLALVFLPLAARAFRRLRA